MNTQLQLEKSDKLNFDIQLLDEHGLIGPEDGKTTLAYEFCIPQDAAHVAQIRMIDPNLKISRSKGRIGCTKNEYLVLGETDNNYLSVLKKLIRLDYIKQIDRTWFE